MQTDPHAPDEFRTIGPLMNMPEFYRAFGCQDGNKMMRPSPTGPKAGRASGIPTRFRHKKPAAVKLRAFACGERSEMQFVRNGAMNRAATRIPRLWRWAIYAPLVAGAL